MNTKFKIDPSPIANIIIEKNLLIPIYQRKYTWDKEHIDALLDDIVAREQDGSEHYFGVIALSSESVSKGGKDVVTSKVIDGQQRLTTSLILLIYMARRVKQIDADIHSIIDTNSNSLNFKHEMEDSTLGQNIRNLIDENYRLLTGNFSKTYDVINSRLSKHSDSYIQKLFNTFRHKFIIAILNYKIDRKEEMLVFENLNSKGSPLKAFDLIRNHIIAMCDRNPKKNLTDFNKQIWNLTDIPKYNFASNSKREDALERFIEFFTIFKTRQEPKKYTNYSIYKNFKAHFKNKTDGEDFDKFLHEMRKYAILFLNIKFSKGVGQNIWLKTLSNKDNHIPFVFHLFNQFGEYNENDETWILTPKINKYLKVSASHLLKTMSVYGTGQSFSKMWNNVIELVVKDSISASELKTKFMQDNIVGTDATPNDSEFKESLLSAPKQKWIPKALIDILEYIARKKNTTNEIIDYQEKSIEHILPQKAKINDWPFIDGQEVEYKRFVNQIGNLVNFNKKANSSLSNKSFSKKLEIYKSSNSPLITGRDFGLKNLNDLTEFNFETIKKRTEKLISILLDEL